MMELMVFVLGLAGLAGLGAIVWLLVQNRRLAAKRGEDDLSQMLLQLVTQMQQQTQSRFDHAEQAWSERQDRNTRLINQELGQIAQQFSQSLDRVTAQVNARLKENADLIQKTHETVGSRLGEAKASVEEVREKLGQLDEASRRIFEIGKDISGLQDILRAPKLRGSMGELFLGSLLEQVFPRKEYYELEYMFASRERVDAVIKLGGRMVSVDSKFPLESFQRVLAAESDDDKKSARREFARTFKARVDEIADKYILPDENTYDFALMYIPAENVYYETIIKDDAFGEDKSLCHYAMQRKVIPVSPNSFYAYLQVIVFGLRGMQIEEGARQIIDGLTRLRGDFERFRERFGVLGGHLRNAQTAYDESEKKLGRIEGKMERLEGQPAELSLGGTETVGQPKELFSE